MTTPPDDHPYRTLGTPAPQPPAMTPADILDRVCAEADRASEHRVKLGLKVRVHPKTFQDIARYTNAKIEIEIRLHTSAGIVRMTPDPEAPEGHPCFDHEPTP